MAALFSKGARNTMIQLWPSNMPESTRGRVGTWLLIHCWITDRWNRRIIYIAWELSFSPLSLHLSILLKSTWLQSNVKYFLGVLVLHPFNIISSLGFFHSLWWSQIRHFPSTMYQLLGRDAQLGMRNLLTLLYECMIAAGRPWRPTHSFQVYNGLCSCYFC